MAHHINPFPNIVSCLERKETAQEDLNDGTSIIRTAKSVYPSTIQAVMGMTIDSEA